MIAESGVDSYAAAVLKFENGIIAQIACGVGVKKENDARIYGSEGFIHVPNPWWSRDGFSVHINGVEEPENIVVEADQPLYAYEIDTVALHLEARQAPSPAMSWDDSLGNAQVLDGWRKAVGLTYPHEEIDGGRWPISSLAKPRVKSDNKMKYGRLKGIDKSISRLVMGVDNQPNLAHASIMFDDFMERGGNAFDTARIYGNGRMEKLLGQWIKSRGVRDEVFILDKGAHTPKCWPSMMADELDSSLECLQTDTIDLYMMHRDNPEVPVSEFIDLMNRWLRAGKIKAFGASNWNRRRVDAADVYAASQGLSGFTAVSNNFSLADMINPPWAGCIASSRPNYMAWHEHIGMPLFSWSSQARGFFTDRSGPDKLDDPQLVKCWYSEDNFEKKRRAETLGKEKGVSALNIALAYVLHQNFPTFALIGPRILSETRTSLPALEVSLSSEEIAWLTLKSESREG